MAVSPQRVLLLPERRYFTGQGFSPVVYGQVRRFSHEQGIAGETAQLQRHFQCMPASWPMAALCRQQAAGDATDSCWLFADAIHLQMEMRDARIMGWDNLDVTDAECHAMAMALAPVFNDSGLELLMSSELRLYVRTASDTILPEFMPAPDMLGRTLSDHLPGDRMWSALFNECQIILYNHPLNVERQRGGKATINGLWFWGQGQRPAEVRHAFGQIESQAADILALAHHGQTKPEASLATLFDLRQARDWKQVESRFDSTLECLFDFADGTLWRWKPSDRWRFWRRQSLGFG